MNPEGPISRQPGSIACRWDPELCTPGPWSHAPLPRPGVPVPVQDQRRPHPVTGHLHAWHPSVSAEDDPAPRRSWELLDRAAWRSHPRQDQHPSEAAHRPEPVDIAVHRHAHPRREHERLVRASPRCARCTALLLAKLPLTGVSVDRVGGCPEGLRPGDHAFVHGGRGSSGRQLRPRSVRTSFTRSALSALTACWADKAARPARHMTAAVNTQRSARGQHPSQCSLFRRIKCNYRYTDRQDGTSAGTPTVRAPSCTPIVRKGSCQAMRTTLFSHPTYSVAVFSPSFSSRPASRRRGGGTPGQVPARHRWTQPSQPWVIPEQSQPGDVYKVGSTASPTCG